MNYYTGLDVHIIDQGTTVFSARITHDLNAMARAANLYWPIWEPSKVPIGMVEELTPLLQRGLSKLLAKPDKFKGFEAKDGAWTYEQFVAFVRQYLDACVKHPAGKIKVTR